MLRGHRDGGIPEASTKRAPRIETSAVRLAEKDGGAKGTFRAPGR